MVLAIKQADLAGVSVFHGSILTEKINVPPKIEGISTYGEFIFENNDKVIIFKHFQIGSGNSIDSSNWKGKENFSKFVLILGEESNLDKFWLDLKTIPLRKKNAAQEDERYTGNKDSDLFECPIEGCTASFSDGAIFNVI